MARTVHHVTTAHRASDCANHRCAATRAAESCPPPWPRFPASGRPACDYNGPEHILSDLRYSAAEMAAARAEGRRPQPATRTHRAPGCISYARRWDDGDIGSYADLFEGAARSAWRMQSVAAIGLINHQSRRQGAGEADAATGRQRAGESWWEQVWPEQAGTAAHAADHLNLTGVRHRGSARWAAW